MKNVNLDYKPGFWLTIIMIMPFILMVEVAWRIKDWKDKRSNG
jgi:hypothetical protein